MKKQLLIVCCAMVLLAVSSCTKQYVSPGSSNQTVIATLLPSDWTLNTDGKSYVGEINVPEIGNNFVRTGGLIVGISANTGVYEQVPEVFGGTSFSYTYNVGNVTLFAQSPDGAAAVKPTDTLRVKITLVSIN